MMSIKSHKPKSKKRSTPLELAPDLEAHRMVSPDQAAALFSVSADTIDRHYGDLFVAISPRRKAARIAELMERAASFAAKGCKTPATEVVA